MLDAWMAGLAEESISFASQTLLAEVASSLADAHWREPLITGMLGPLPGARSVGRRAALEVLTCSAAAVAHERLGRIAVDTEAAAEAVRRLSDFVDQQGFGTLVRVVLAITSAGSQAALAHYGEILEEDFLSGCLHRPWSISPLDDDLWLGIAAGHYRLQVRGAHRYVRGTAEGRRALLETRSLLAAAGYLAARLDLTWVSHFNVRADLDGDVSRVAPDGPAQRADITRFCRVAPGAAVLDVGCGQGTQLFEGGLGEAAGPTGRLVGLDPAEGMLARARRKALLRGTGNVEFVCGRAEALPFADRRFDLALAVGALQFARSGQAVAEMIRVVRPGGAVVVIGVGQGAFAAPAVQEWFRPLLELARRHGIDPAGRSQVYEHLGTVLGMAGLTDVQTVSAPARLLLTDPEVVVRMVVQGSDFGLEVLERVPWAARQELIAELLVRGRLFCATARADQHTVAVRTQFGRGAVP